MPKYSGVGASNTWVCRAEGGGEGSIEFTLLNLGSADDISRVSSLTSGANRERSDSPEGGYQDVNPTHYTLQGYLAHKKQSSPLGSPYEPRYFLL